MEAEVEKTVDLSELKCGIKAALPIAVGYLPIAVAFGLIAKSSGVPNHISLLMSLVVFAGASQFVAVNLMLLGASPVEIVMTTFILNLRHFLMSSSVSQRIQPGTSKKMLALLAFGVTDESFTLASTRKEQYLKRHFMLGLHFTAYTAWVSGTYVGLFMAAGLPLIIQNSMGIALYAMFIGLLVPAVKDCPPVLRVALLAILINTLLHFVPVLNILSSGWNIIIATILASAAGTILFPGEVEQNG